MSGPGSSLQLRCARLCDAADGCGMIGIIHHKDKIQRIPGEAQLRQPDRERRVGEGLAQSDGVIFLGPNKICVAVKRRWNHKTQMAFKMELNIKCIELIRKGHSFAQVVI